MKKLKSLFALVLALLAITVLSGCTSVSTAADQVALHYEGGSFSAKKFKECYGASEREYNGPGDNHYYYPTNQRFVDATGGQDSDFEAIKVVSKDNVELAVPITINFYLKTDCETLREFHETVGNRFKAYMDGDETSDGWLKMLNVVIRQPLDTTLDRIAQEYKWRDLYNNPEVKTAIEKQVNEQIEAIVRRQTNNKDFFDNWSALVQKPTPTNGDLVNAIAAEQNNVASAQAAEAKARADKAAAEAQIAVQAAEGMKIAAIIRGYGSVENYLKALCIQQGCNPFQPTYLVGGTTGPKPQ